MLGVMIVRTFLMKLSCFHYRCDILYLRIIQLILILIINIYYGFLRHSIHDYFVNDYSVFDPKVMGTLII